MSKTQMARAINEIIAEYDQTIRDMANSLIVDEYEKYLSVKIVGMEELAVRLGVDFRNPKYAEKGL